MKKTLCAALTVLALVGCAADDQGGEPAGDLSNASDEMPIDNGDGSFSVPASWNVDLDNVGDDEAVVETGAVDKVSSDTREVVGPDIAFRNTTYTSHFPYNWTISGPLTTVRWSWSFWPSNPANMTVLICRQTTSDCVNASSASGVTSFWQNKGYTSNVSFYLLFRVNGTGSMPTAYGNKNQVIVSAL